MSGKRIGYIRVSTLDQNPERQLEGIQTDKKFIDYASGSTIKRPKLELMLDYAREEDHIIVHSMDRLARNTKDLKTIVDLLVSKGAKIEFIKENLTFSGDKSPIANLLLYVMGAIAEFEWEIIRERQREGIEIAKKKGRYRGRKTKITPELVEKLKKELQTREPKSKIAKGLGISRGLLYRTLKEINE